MVFFNFVSQDRGPKNDKNAIGIQCEFNLFVKGRSKMQNEHRLIARWKDILLYLDTYHLILHIRNANKKVDGGNSRVQSHGTRNKLIHKGLCGQLGSLQRVAIEGETQSRFQVGGCGALQQRATEPVARAEGCFIRHG